MPLPSFFQRLRRMAASGPAAVDATPLSSADVEAARVRARRRLVGMVVLVGAGVVGFPWLFETQPRPMSTDIEIVQAGEAGGDLQISGTVRPSSSRAVGGRVAVSGIVAPPSADADDEAVEGRATPADDRPKAKAPKADDKAVARVADKSPDKLAPKPAAKDAGKELAAKDNAKAKDSAKDSPKPVAKADKPADKAADKTADKAADKAAPTRYVVQFGAFADVNTAHEARMKVERLGIKTYAQQIDTPAGKRIRVRMGPYTEKAEADKAMATLRKAGMTGAVLTL